ncbi:hypothetical protein GQ43DRAFT_363503 [Delitschia confertaspora ATCC 74209]|uniref:E3 ubiquitin-protein ligase listerin n=1 Tax=Delitschia confertaspora ATCC 74209 TaxID=1513339 RepID=A0A9P4MT81_9PLEO|nr:hypothetical protein GQ43DRAFT_363503 [Delitschia confertaspora ATCC 74209]
MSKRQAKSQASSSRAAFGAATTGFGTPSSFGFSISSSPLSYVTEPPDLSSISDPNVVVYFRNLSKKDSTTKAKALEDLQAYISALDEPVEEAVLEAWIKAFPRTSIDNSRRVRQLAFTLQGAICVSAGKRVAKYMPKAVGAWLSGLYDTDRATVKATQDSLRQVFSTVEKLQNVRRAYQQPILEYCRDAISNETALTLSDERTVSPDDAEAKYGRVISACIAVIGSLLTELRPEDLAKCQSDYETLLGTDKIWTFATNSDASVRRSLHRFLRTCLSTQPESVEKNLDAISKAYLSNALNSDQAGSSYEYANTLAQLTARFPMVWTDHYSSKTSVTKRLRQFLKRGSQSSPREFWEQVKCIVESLPKDVIPDTAADVAETLSAMRGGIIRKEEPRTNIPVAFSVYLDTADHLCTTLPDDDKHRIMTELILPIIQQYIRPDPELSQWTLPPNGSDIVCKAMALGCMPAILHTEWPQYAANLVQDIKTSAPEQAKDHDKSQKALIDQAARLAKLQEYSLNKDPSSQLRDTFLKASASIVKEALEVLKGRNGKPYGAAGVIAELLRRNKSLVLSDPRTKEQLSRFAQDDVPQLLLSPSATHCTEILFSFCESPFFKDAWISSLKTVLHAPESTRKMTALESIMAPAEIQSFDLASSDPELQNYIKTKVAAALVGEVTWDSFDRILYSASKTMSSATTDDILSNMADALSLSDQSPNALRGFHHVVKQNPSFLKPFLSSPKGSNLLAQLLSVSESSSDDITQEASAVYSSLQALLATGSGSKQSMYDVIHQGLLNASKNSISVETLVDLAKDLLNSVDAKEEIGKILPSTDEWNSALLPFLRTPPRSSLAFSNPLEGAVYMVKHDITPNRPQSVPRDTEGYSAAFRIGQFVTKLLKDTDLLAKIPFETRHGLLENVAVTFQLADDNLGLAGANNLWVDYNAESEADAIALMDEAQAFITRHLKELSSNWTHSSQYQNQHSLLSWAMDVLLRCPEEALPKAYWLSRTHSVLISSMIEVHGWNSDYNADMQEKLKQFRKLPNPLVLAGFLAAFKEPLATSRACERMCNEFVADLTYSDIEQKQEKILQQLVLLNIILYGQDEIGRSIAKPRLVSFVKHIVPWVQDTAAPLSIRAEVCRTLTVLLPFMADIYDSLWGNLLEALSESWSKTEKLQDGAKEADSGIPFVHASLKLYAQLRTLTEGEDPNDDLVDAWKESEETIAQGLVNLLKRTQHFPDEYHQPLKVVNEVLARQTAKVPLKYLESAEDLYPLLYVDSQPVQQTAFKILQKQIAAAQEQISIDVVIEKTTARLPEELLSLILEAPTVAALAEANFERSMPLPLRGYFFSWFLVFEHLEHSSYKVKSDYVEQLKEGDYAPGLLNFMFDFLGHTHNKPADVSKFDVTTYTPDVEPPRQDTQWILAHLYFLCLRHIPSLTKSWWIDCKSRPVVVSLEGWTEKYISPPVISAALETVSTWAKSQEVSDPDSPFTIKISPRARELTASYIVDDQTMTMRISLPPSFPLSNALVEGLSRVAVDEKKWQSWLRISQGAITFANGNLVDGLTTFKRNVEGALKGQTECAICYSIVGPDKRVPEKRCSTCKNLFHGGCLFKWFKTSSSSSCPLCRNSFHYA